MPRGKKDSSTVSVVHEICSGLDVHKKSVSVCLLSTDESGAERSEVAEFGTFTDELFQLREWVLERGCPIVAMESTGPYWTPIHNVLEGFVQVILVNARHMRNVPGRKTDMADSRWIAGLLRHGLLRGAFIPPKAAATMARLDENEEELPTGSRGFQAPCSQAVPGGEHQDRLSGIRSLWFDRQEPYEFAALKGICSHPSRSGGLFERLPERQRSRAS